MNLTKEILEDLLLYNPDTGELFWKLRDDKYFSIPLHAKRWNAAWAGKKAFTALDKKGYHVGAIFNRGVKAHRIIWLLVNGEEPEQIDHINGVKNDNRIINLRSVSNSENHMNMGIQKNNKSGYPGVYYSIKDKKWISKITKCRKPYTLGYFINLEDAIKAKKIAEREMNFHPNHGDRIRNDS